MHLSSGHRIDVPKAVGIRRYFPKPKGVREQNFWETLTYCFK